MALENVVNCRSNIPRFLIADINIIINNNKRIIEVVVEAVESVSIAGNDVFARFTVLNVMLNKC